MWDKHKTWDSAETAWDQRAKKSQTKKPLKGLKRIPNMVGITQSTKKFLKTKSLWWMLTQDHKREVFRGFFRHPLRYGWRYVQSLFQKRSYSRDGDFFLYGVPSVDEFENLLKKDDVLFVIGFSYCHKPFECPSGRFTDECIHDQDHPVCQQCFIGKCMHALPREKTIPLIIPTVHYIGGKIFEIVHAHPDKQVLFLITACEMTLEMFGDWGNMAGIRGVGVRLGGRICNTMEAFRLSERGVKPGLTVVLDETKVRFLEFLKTWRQNSDGHVEKVCEDAAAQPSAPSAP